ncbi:hypothetical protein Pfo_001861 [Paulownia fortunei]|nr:hypothetical protein Pfo_001861 [Paulownia fortunei]
MRVSKCSIFLICFLFLDGVTSEVYRVGDDSGWNSGTGTNYLSWSEKYNFTVGDVLVFKYSKVQHNVKEVTDATYRSCDAKSGVLATYESGNDEIRLNEARKYNYICDKDNHCVGGMRFSIYVFGASNSNNTTPPPPPSLGKSCAFTVRGKLIHIVGMGVFLIFTF